MATRSRATEGTSASASGTPARRHTARVMIAAASSDNTIGRPGGQEATASSHAVATSSSRPAVVSGVTTAWKRLLRTP
ncbi:hypothetical protein [Amycolatopsis rifamycinica]|uniref:hypothetical protein n=1 Tax=Amycolatopsis rifamycinica TaxID=287986 RepID=UPI00190F5B86|nr:hypothetical protein [Amycolatopsis rifamycinica]